MLENENSKKDNWDKFEIFSKFLGAVVLVFIPIVIKLGADSISDSMERGKMIQVLISDFTKNEQQRKDFALIALDTAIPIKEECTFLWINCQPNPEKDKVVDSAILLLSNLVRNASTRSIEIETTRTIITRRAGKEFFCRKLNEQISRQSKSISAINPSSGSDSLDQNRKARAAYTIANLLENSECSTSPSTSTSPLPTPFEVEYDLKGIRLVYIQYKSDRRTAEELQKVLQGKGILAPGIQQVNGIKNNDIRYANSSDRSLAENLRDFLKTEKDIQIEDKNLIDLSTKGYKVPPGQLEIWLKD